MESRRYRTVLKTKTFSVHRFRVDVHWLRERHTLKPHLCYCAVVRDRVVGEEAPLEKLLSTDCIV